MRDTILVTVDSLRADHCGWQSEADLTPNLSSVATDSLTFTTAVAPGPRTLSSVPVSHTGVPFAVTDHDAYEYKERVARIKAHIEQFDTLSERFSDLGYTTMAFTANPWTSRENGFDAGFDRFREVGKDGGRISGAFEDTFLELPAMIFDQWLHKDAWFSQWRTFYDEVNTAIRETDGPVFAWIFLLDVHNPYLVPRADRADSTTFGLYSGLLRANDAFNQTGGKTMYRNSMSPDLISKMRDAYRDSVRSVDGFAGKLFDDADDDTVIVFHSDHGEAFGEHGTFGHEPVLYEENVHVPFFVANGGVSDTVEGPVSTARVPDITLSAAMEELEDPNEYTEDWVVARNEGDTKLAVRGRRWKYIHGEEEEELYDLDEDPDETEDLSSERDDELAEFRSRRDEYLEGLPDPPSSEGVESDEMRSHLESLGYLQE